MDYQYQFKHDSGRIVIAQSWKEYNELNNHKEYGYPKFLGKAPMYRSVKDDTYDLNLKINRFWTGAIGFNKIGHLSTMGIVCSGNHNIIRLFLRTIANHAAMQGDIETYNKANRADKYFHSNGRIEQLLLTA